MKKLNLLMICFLLVGCANKNEKMMEEDFTPSNNEVAVEESTDTQETSTSKQDTQNITIDTNQDQTQVNESFEDSATNHSSSSDVDTTTSNTSNESVHQPVQQMIQLSIDCHTINQNMNKLSPNYAQFVPSNGIILPSTNISFKEGDTLLVALKRICNQQDIHIRVRGGYVQGIGNIDEFACGQESGWMFSVNGRFINHSAKDYVLHNGDVVKWMYTCANGRDLDIQ